MRTNQAAADAAGAQYSTAANAYRDGVSVADTLKAGDFVGNTEAVARRRQQRNLRASLAPSGAMGIGAAAANPTAIAQQKLMLDDAFNRDAEAQMESDVKEYQNNKRMLNLNLMNQASNRQLQFGGLSAQIASSMQSPVAGLIGAGIGADGQIGAAAI